MALIRNTAAMTYKGRVGNTTFYVEGGRQLARVAQNSSNYGETARRTEKQQARRAKWANLVNFYKLSKGWMPKAFENKKRTQSDYNRFMQLNLATSSIYLTKSMYAAGGCVVEPFRVSEGSLRTINVEKRGNVWATDLAVGSFAIAEGVTVGQLTDALLANNAHLRENMQISFISYQQDINLNGIPQLICTAYELTLRKGDASLVWDFLPPFCAQVINGYLGTADNISTGAFCYMLSDSTNGRTLVSTQTLVNNNAILIGQYSTEEAAMLSVASYGVEEDVFLMSGSRSQDAAAATFFVAAAMQGTNGTIYPVERNGTTIGNLAATSEDMFTIEMSSVINAVVSDISVEIGYNTTAESAVERLPLQIISVTDNKIVVKVPNSIYEYYLVSAKVTIKGATTAARWFNPTHE